MLGLLDSEKLFAVIAQVHTHGTQHGMNLFFSNLKCILTFAGRCGASEVPSNSGRLFLQEQRAPCPQVVHRC